MLLFISILTINLIVWWLLQRRIRQERQRSRERLTNAYTYIDELQARCHRYQTALAEQAKTGPVAQGYAIQCHDMTYLVDAYLN